jgi:hypothetical protein
VDYCGPRNYEGEISLTYKVVFEDIRSDDPKYSVKVVAPFKVGENQIVGISFQANSGSVLVPMSFEQEGDRVNTSFEILDSLIKHTYIVAYYGDDEEGCPYLLSAEVERQ